MNGVRRQTQSNWFTAETAEIAEIGLALDRPGRISALSATSAVKLLRSPRPHAITALVHVTGFKPCPDARRIPSLPNQQRRAGQMYLSPFPTPTRFAAFGALLAALESKLGFGRDCPERGAGGQQSNAASKPLKPSQQKSIRSYQDRIAEHQTKLDAYRNNPDAFDNQGLLKHAPNDAVRQKIIDGRIRHLENDINTFQDNIRKIENGG